MKISELTLENLANYLKIDDLDEALIDLQLCWDAALSFIVNRTGMKKEDVEDCDDLTYSFFALCGEMYQNRQLRFEQGRYNNELVLDAIDAHSINLLPSSNEEENDGQKKHWTVHEENHLLQK